MKEGLKGKRCGESCCCNQQTVTEMRDAAVSAPEHRTLNTMGECPLPNEVRWNSLRKSFLSARYHSSVLALNRSRRHREDDRDALLARMSEQLTQVVDELAFLSLERRASQLVNEDSDYIGLPWSCVEDVDKGMDSLEKIQCIQRLLICPSVSSSQSRYMSDTFKIFFTEDFKGCFYNGLPQG